MVGHLGEHQGYTGDIESLRNQPYHTLEEYQKKGIGPFLEHIVEYLAGHSTVPISKTQSGYNNDITFTFSDELLVRFAENPEDMEKPYSAAIKQGFHGGDIQYKNGIFYLLKKRDAALIGQTKRIIRSHWPEVMQDLGIDDGLGDLKRVKLGWGCPPKFILGMYNPQNSRMIFLDFIELPYR